MLTTISKSVYLPPTIHASAKPRIEIFAEEVVSRKILDWVADAERNLPSVSHWDSWGAKKDELITSEGWKRLWHMGISEG